MSVGAPPTPPSAIGTPGSLVTLLDGLQEIQALIPAAPALAGFASTLALYRWQPNQVDLPALWNWLLPSTTEMRDTARIRDTLNISTRIGIQFTDVEDRMAYVEAVADVYRATVDPNFWNGQATPSRTRFWSTWAFRTSMNSFSADVGGVPVVGVEFVQTFWLDRTIR